MNPNPRPGELLIPLSGAPDLAHGYPIGTSRQICDLAIYISSELGINTEERITTFYTALLRFIGCTGFSAEEASIFNGDDIEFKRLFTLADPEDNPSNFGILFSKFKKDPIHLLKVIFSMKAFYSNLVTSDCETASFLSEKMLLPNSVALALSQVYERYDGKGKYGGRKKEQIHIATRIVQVVHLYLISYLAGGRELAFSLLKKRAGKQLDPDLCELVKKKSEIFELMILDEKHKDRLYKFSKAYERPGTTDQINLIFESFSDMVDIKSSYTTGHSRKMSEVVKLSSDLLGFNKERTQELVVASLCHNLGLTSVPNGILDKPAKLSFAEKKKIELHPYFTYLVLDNELLFRNIIGPAIHHHEKPDGSGYYKGLDAKTLTDADQLVMLADILIALQSDRSHRKAYSKLESHKIVKEEFISKKGNPKLIQALFSTIDSKKKFKITNKFSLTDREIEISIELSKGLTRKEVGANLHISDRTVQHHIQHIYDKTGINSRAVLVLLAKDSGWLDRT